MRQVIILIIAFLISGCYTQLQMVKQDEYESNYESSSYAPEEEYEYEDMDTTTDEVINVYHHYYPAADPYFDYLYYNDPFWYHHTRFYLGYNWYYTRWYRPVWQRPWWSWCYYCMDYYSPWYSWYYPNYYYPWGGYDYYPYYSSVNHGKRTFGRRGTASTLRDGTKRTRTDVENKTLGIARKRSSTTSSDPDSRTRVSEPDRKKKPAVRKRSTNSRSKSRSGKVVKRRSSSPNRSGSNTRSRSSGSSVRRSSPSGSSSSSGTRSSSGSRSSGSNRSSGKRR